MKFKDKGKTIIKGARSFTATASDYSRYTNSTYETKVESVRSWYGLMVDRENKKETLHFEDAFCILLRAFIEGEWQEMQLDYTTSDKRDKDIVMLGDYAS